MEFSEANRQRFCTKVASIAYALGDDLPTNFSSLLNF